MRLLLHTCCAPCLSGSRPALEAEGFEVTSLWFNPNIHPYSEWERRLQTLERYLFLRPLRSVIVKEYPLWPFIKGLSEAVCPRAAEVEGAVMSPEEKKERCAFCYRERMKRSAGTALELGFDAFTTTLLLSKFQEHDLLRSVCRQVSEEAGIEFVYRDLREHWNDSIRESRELRLYRQNYCGCIFSEHERMAPNDHRRVKA